MGSMVGGEEGAVNGFGGMVPSRVMVKAGLMARLAKTADSLGCALVSLGVSLSNTSVILGKVGVSCVSLWLLLIVIFSYRCWVSKK